MRYRSKTPKDGERVVHNFPAAGRTYGVDGFRYWTEDADEADRRESDIRRVRCYCDWTDVVPEHYGTVAWVAAPEDVICDEDGTVAWVEESRDGYFCAVIVERVACEAWNNYDVALNERAQDSDPEDVDW